MALSPRAYSLCVDGNIGACYDPVEEEWGTRECEDGHWGPCMVEGDPPVTGQVQTGYKVLTVIYAPPGKAGGGSTSSVSYGSGSSTGTSTSSSSSFKQGYTASVTARSGFLGGGGVSFSYGHNSTNSETSEIKKSESTTITRAGPAVDGIDHDRDQIWLWLNPVLDVSVTDDEIEWSFSDTEIMDIQYVYVGDLKNPAQMPPGVAAVLASYGITKDDYAEILAADPLWDGSTTIDPDRYIPLNFTFPYEPPYAPNDPVPTLSFNTTHTNTNTTSSSTSNDYTVGVSYEEGLDFDVLFESKLKFEGKWTWSDVETESTSTGTSESATVTIGGPSYGYTGPTDMGVYYDVLYKTFMFAPYSAEPTLTGAVYDGDSYGVVSQDVVVIDEKGNEFHAITNRDGKFRVFGEVFGALTLVVGEEKFSVKDTSAPIEVWLSSKR